MTQQVSVDSFKEALTCGICQDIVTLPVHGECCEKAKSLTPGCLACVRRYYELYKAPNQRCQTKKAWGGCGCDIDLKNKYANNYYNHTTQLDMVRNLLGPSVCHHENCNAACETAAELRRHLCGSSTASDKHGNCKEAIMKCNHCSLYGKRGFIEGEHYKKNHTYILCDVCCCNILSCNIRYHYNKHKEEIANLQKKVHNYEDKTN